MIVCIHRTSDYTYIVEPMVFRFQRKKKRNLRFETELPLKIFGFCESDNSTSCKKTNTTIKQLHIMQALFSVYNPKKCCIKHKKMHFVKKHLKRS